MINRSMNIFVVLTKILAGFRVVILALKLIVGWIDQKPSDFFKDAMIDGTKAIVQFVMYISILDNFTQIGATWRDSTERKVRLTVGAVFLGALLPSPFIVACSIIRYTLLGYDYRSAMDDNALDWWATRSCAVVSPLVFIYRSRQGWAELGYVCYALKHPWYALFPSSETYYYTPAGMVKRSEEKEMEASAAAPSNLSEKLQGVA